MYETVPGGSGVRLLMDDAAMTLRTGKPGERLPRGVWVLPYMGPNSELVVAAIRGDGRIVGVPIVIPWGTNSVEIVEALATALDVADSESRIGLRVV